MAASLSTFDITSLSNCLQRSGILSYTRSVLARGCCENLPYSCGRFVFQSDLLFVFFFFFRLRQSQHLTCRLKIFVTMLTSFLVLSPFVLCSYCVQSDPSDIVLLSHSLLSSSRRESILDCVPLKKKLLSSPHGRCEVWLSN